MVRVNRLVTNSALTTGVHSNLECAVCENEGEANRSDTLLDWRRLNQTEYLKMPQIAYKYRFITATSVPSERMSSSSGH